jgi:anti-anti-sigma regulatory factor
VTEQAVPLPDEHPARGEPEPADAVENSRRCCSIDVLTVHPVGVLDAATVGDLDVLIASVDGTPIVIDLSECTLSDRSALDLLEPQRWGRDPDTVCIACVRAIGRQLLELNGVSQRFAVFHCDADAEQSYLLAGAGYGPGWRASSDG